MSHTILINFTQDTIRSQIIIMENKQRMEEKRKTPSPVIHKTLPSPKNLDFGSLPWNLNHPEEHNYILLKTSTEWNDSHLKAAPFSIHSYASTKLDVSPATTSLNYGTTIWEGLKCFRTK